MALFRSIDTKRSPTQRIRRFLHIPVRCERSRMIKRNVYHFSQRSLSHLISSTSDKSSKSHVSSGETSQHGTKHYLAKTAGDAPTQDFIEKHVSRAQIRSPTKKETLQTFCKQDNISATRTKSTPSLPPQCSTSYSIPLQPLVSYPRMTEYRTVSSGSFSTDKPTKTNLKSNAPVPLRGLLDPRPFTPDVFRR